MCGRYTLIAGGVQVAELFHLAEAPALTPRYNIAPSQNVPVIRQQTAERQLVWMRWGLIPSWSRDTAIGYKLLNARSETVADKPSFRAALRQRRCLLVADGFFEWQPQGRKKQPFYFRRRDGQPFALAGLWERWQGAEQQPLQSCTLLTTTANELVTPIHDRMPVFLAPADHDRWLDPALTKPDALADLYRPCPPSDLSVSAVSPRVNDPRFDGPECIAPAGPAGLFDLPLTG